ncbi:MAG: aminopeptidase [Cyclobacteriaceae bacterium]|nr:aminopeptidase [Cyclobacteriaceae bacterium]
MLKKLFLALTFIFIAFVAFNYELVLYGLGQARGQMHILMNTRTIAETLADPNFPDSLKTNLRLVTEIKNFAFDSLGIRYSTNYSNVYDQQGKELMFVVTACEPFMLAAKEWHFPLLGTFSYKGFFDQEKAIELAKALKNKGLDTNVRTAGGWSTLGWFEDPILSNMLDDTEAGFAELIIHELTHGTLFVKDSVRFNENLATFVGVKGTERYLEAKYGKDNNEVNQYRQQWKDRNKLTEHILHGAQYLDSLYQNMDQHLPYEEKMEMKNTAISLIINNIDTLSLSDKQKYLDFYSKHKPNNTLFMSYLRYRGEFALLEKQLEKNYNADIKEMLEDYKHTYASL